MYADNSVCLGGTTVGMSIVVKFVTLQYGTDDVVQATVFTATGLSGVAAYACGTKSGLADMGLDVGAKDYFRDAVAVIRVCRCRHRPGRDCLRSGDIGHVSSLEHPAGAVAARFGRCVLVLRRRMRYKI